MVASRSSLRTTPPRIGRQPWADNLRIAIVVGVIVTHVATAYLIEVDWYYAERTGGVVAEVLGWAIVGVGALFGMGLLFLVAGLFSARSLARKGSRRFVLDRLLRLGIPLVVFVFVIDLVTDFAGYRGAGGGDGPRAYVGRWWREDADLGPAWFIAVLLGFSVAYGAWRAWRPAPIPTGEPLPGRVLLHVAVGMLGATFLTRLVWPLLSDSVFGLNLWELPQMVALFTLGVLAGERGWLDGPVPARLRRRCGSAAIAGVLLTPAIVSVAVGGDVAPFVGGFHVQALALPVMEALVAVGLSVWTLEWFRRRFDHAGPLAATLGRSSYAAYLVHPPVVVGLSLVLRSAPVAAEVKFALVAAVASAASFAVGHLLTRWRPLARIV
jgi:glucans biosynthesis protein C